MLIAQSQRAQPPEWSTYYLTLFAAKWMDLSSILMTLDKMRIEGDSGHLKVVSKCENAQVRAAKVQF